MNKKKVLIVDDTIDTVELIRKRLRAENYDTDEAYDGEQCLEKVKTYKPDIIILDVMMPKLDGYEVCNRLKTNENTKYIPILMLTAKSEVDNKIKGLELGADDYLAKPFDFKELSARIQSLLKIREAHEKLVEVEKCEAIDIIVDEVAHEVRNPLVSIGGFARRIYESLPEGNPNRKYMEMIIEEVGRLENMVRQLVEIKSLSISYKEPSDINEIILKAIDSYESEIEEKDIDIETDLKDGLPLIHADKDQLQKAIGNLIKNSIEAMVSYPRIIKITSRLNDNQIEIQISDTGKGISKDKIKHIFDPLYTSKIYGPGLGLTFALKIVQNHRGTITVESEPGKGSTFSISLPIRKL